MAPIPTDLRVASDIMERVHRRGRNKLHVKKPGSMMILMYALTGQSHQTRGNRTLTNIIDCQLIVAQEIQVTTTNVIHQVQNFKCSTTLALNPYRISGFTQKDEMLKCDFKLTKSKLTGSLFMKRGMEVMCASTRHVLRPQWRCSKIMM